MTVIKLDEVDKKLLQLAQDDFPITERPWEKLGYRLKITEKEVLSRFKRLRKEGVIRKVGPIIDSKKLNLNASTLVAMRVPEERIEEVTKNINEYDSVTHNYLRDHEYNLWFTVITPSEEKLRMIMKEIKQRTEITEEDILELATLRRFKVDVRFQFS